MPNQVKTQSIIDWLEGPFYESLDKNIQRASIPALSFAAVQLANGVRGVQGASFDKLTTPGAVASWLEGDYWREFTRRYGKDGDARHAGAIALGKAARQLRSGEWLQSSLYTA